MARQSPSDPLRPLPVHLWADFDSAPPRIRDVFSQLAHFFDQAGYTKTFNALLKEASAEGVEIDIVGWEEGLKDGSTATLMQMWEAWREEEDGFPAIVEEEDVVEDGKAEAVKEKEGVDDESDSSGEGEDESSDDDSSEEDEDEDEEESATEGAKAGVVDDEAEVTDDDSSDDESDAEAKEPANISLKRKRKASDDSSDSESTEESSSEEDSDPSSDEEVPPAKRTKLDAVASADVATIGGDEPSEDESDAVKTSGHAVSGGVKLDTKTKRSAQATIGGNAEDSADDEPTSSDDEADTESSSESDDDSDSESESDSNSSPPSGPKEPVIKRMDLSNEASDSQDTSSSATLVASPIKSKRKPKGTIASKPTNEQQTQNPATDTSASNGDMHPDRLKRMPGAQADKKQPKKQAVPFQRIPETTVVDPRFASNEYVPYDYADRAYKDLSVTKGKGFTKEKNKKKRGAYRGGAIDLTPKGIKFDD